MAMARRYAVRSHVATVAAEGSPLFGVSLNRSRQAPDWVDYRGSMIADNAQYMQVSPAKPADNARYEGQ